jgi:hypothetical protein
MTGSCQCISAVFTLGLCLPATAKDEATELKVTRVAIFSSGVAYYECDAAVTDNACAELKFRTGQINDILKSLVVQDLDGGSIGAVGYASMAPVSKALESFTVNLADNLTLEQLLDQLRGEPIEIIGPRAVKGTIVGVEEQILPGKANEQAPENRPKVYLLNILTDMGLQQLKLNELQGIKLTNEKVNADLRKALATLAASHDSDKKTIVLRFEGKGRRRVHVSYLLESPIWKTSYRLVLAPEKKPFLQGWAMAENATDDDWKDVRLSLISGRPISFTMDLYTPLYVPRPQETLELYASLRAPAYDAGVARGGMGGGGGYGGGAGGLAETVTGRRIARAAAPAPPQAAPALRSLGYVAEKKAEAATERDIGLKGAGVESAAKAQQAGELFEYVIRTPVSIARQHSAMLPIVNEEIAGEKLSIFNPATHPKFPLNGLLMENTTNLHLMQGPVTVFDGNVYAGDAKLPDLNPGEKRLIAYALDLGVEIATERKPRPQELMSLRIAKGTLWQRHKQIDERTYVIKNKDKRERQVIVEQPYQSEWTLVEPKEAYERTPSMWRFKVPVPAGQSVALKVRLERTAEESVAMSSAGLDAIQLYIRSQVISPAVKEVLEKVVAMRTEMDRVSRELAEAEKQGNEAVQEQGRLRENLKVVERNSDIYQRQIKKFDEMETSIDKLRTRVAELRREQEQKRSALETYIISSNAE